jgi:hypothetical protein
LEAASVHGPEGLQAAREAGLRDASSSLFDPELWRARALGCRLVKLFPAAPLGPHYWRQLLAPLGDPLPFCIAAGGLAAADVLPWRAAGVNAVALGSRLGMGKLAATTFPARQALRFVLSVNSTERDSFATNNQKSSALRAELAVCLGITWSIRV